MIKAENPDNNLKATLLLVDDDRLVLATLQQGLIRAGYQVMSAESADDAESMLVHSKLPDLAILDVNMPSRNGLDLAASLSSLYRLPFILLTAYSDQAIVEQAASSGALGYVVKPVDVSELIPTVEAALARAKDLKALLTNSEQLQKALSSERDISIAIGITMVQYRIDRNDAFNMLRTKARSEHRKLAAFAADVIKASELLNLHKNVKK